MVLSLQGLWCIMSWTWFCNERAGFICTRFWVTLTVLTLVICADASRN